MQTLEECLRALVDLMNSTRSLTPAPVDDIVDPYLIGFGAQTAEKRMELAKAFHERTEPSERRDLIHARILKAIIP